MEVSYHLKMFFVNKTFFLHLLYLESIRVTIMCRGSLSTITVRGTREEVEAAMRSCEPVFFEAIPLSLEEIFISETEVAGYDVKKLIF